MIRLDLNYWLSDRKLLKWYIYSLVWFRNLLFVKRCVKSLIALQEICNLFYEILYHYKQTTPHILLCALLLQHFKPIFAQVWYFLILFANKNISMFHKIIDCQKCKLNPKMKWKISLVGYILPFLRNNLKFNLICWTSCAKLYF